MPSPTPDPPRRADSPGEGEHDDPEKIGPSPPQDFEYYRELPLDHEPSWGLVDEKHWSRTRGERNERVIEYYRQRSHAPGVEEGGAPRNQYCMSCDGVIPLSYFQMKPADNAVQHCPHCGVKLEQRIHRMFNWVEIDQPHDSDLKALLPLIAGAALVGLGLLLLYLL